MACLYFYNNNITNELNIILRFTRIICCNVRVYIFNGRLVELSEAKLTEPVEGKRFKLIRL